MISVLLPCCPTPQKFIVPLCCCSPCQSKDYNFDSSLLECIANVDQ